MNLIIGLLVFTQSSIFILNGQTYFLIELIVILTQTIDCSKVSIWDKGKLIMIKGGIKEHLGPWVLTLHKPGVPAL